MHAATTKDVDKAVKAAEKSLGSTWKQHSAAERGSLLMKLADLIDANKETLAAVESWDNGA